MFATDRAYELATVDKLPFRDAYRIVGEEVTQQLDSHVAVPLESQEQLAKRLAARRHLGGAGNLGLAKTQKQLEEVKSVWENRKETFTEAIQKLVGKNKM